VSKIDKSSSLVLISLLSFPRYVFLLWDKVFCCIRVVLIDCIDGIAASGVLSILNYILLGLAFETDGYYLHSFEVFLAILAVFPGSGNVGFILLEYRLGHRSMWASLVETCTWIPFLYAIPFLMIDWI